MLEALAIIVLVFLVIDGASSFATLLGWFGAGKEDSAWDEDRENFIDKVVTVTTAFGSTGEPPEGSVELNGARWNARVVDGTNGLKSGAKARVESMEGLTLVVSAIDQNCRGS